MMTREETDKKIAEIRENNPNITEANRQLLIDKLLTDEANQLEPGNNLAIVQASVFGILLVGVLAVVKYSLLPLLLL